MVGSDVYKARTGGQTISKDARHVTYRVGNEDENDMIEIMSGDVGNDNSPLVLFSILLKSVREALEKQFVIFLQETAEDDDGDGAAEGGAAEGSGGMSKSPSATQAANAKAEGVGTAE